MTATLTFTTPPPGLAPHTDFTLTELPGANSLFAMRAVADEELRLYLLDPQTVVAGYAPTISDAHVSDLQLTSPDDAMVLVGVHAGTDGVSVNLMAPVVVNRNTGVATQVILEDQGYPLRATLN